MPIPSCQYCQTDLLMWSVWASLLISGDCGFSRCGKIMKNQIHYFHCGFIFRGFFSVTKGETPDSGSTRSTTCWRRHTHRVLRKISSAEGKVTSPTCISLEGHEQCVSGHLDDSSWLGRLSSGHHDIVASSIGSAPQQLSLRFSWSSWHYSFSAPLCGWRPRWEPLKSLNLRWGLEKLRSQGSWNVVSGFPEAIPDMRPGQQHSHSCHHHSHDRPRWQRLMAQDLVTGDRGSETGGDWIQQDVVDSPGFSRMLETWTVWRHSMMQQSDW